MKVRAAAGPQFASALRLHSSGLRLSEKKICLGNLFGPFEYFVETRCVANYVAMVVRCVEPHATREGVLQYSVGNLRDLQCFVTYPSRGTLCTLLCKRGYGKTVTPRISSCEYKSTKTFMEPMWNLFLF